MLSAHLPPVPIDILEAQTRRAVATGCPAVASTTRLDALVCDGERARHAYPIGPALDYEPATGRVVGFDGSWHPATAEDDALALQLDDWSRLADAVGIHDDGAAILPDKHSMRRAWSVARRVVGERWRLLATRLVGGEADVARWVPPGADLLATLDAWGVDLDDVHDEIVWEDDDDLDLVVAVSLDADRLDIDDAVVAIAL